MKNSKLLTISEASYLLGVSESTLKRWETEDKLILDERTKGNQRRYKFSSPRPGMKREQGCIRQTIAHARVSTHDQKADLERQKQLLELYCVSSGWTYELISDLELPQKRIKKTY